jgi:diguanylate cyclase
VSNRDDLTKAQPLARAAMERMAAEKIAPHPDNFALWYAYHAGRNAELKRSIDILLEHRHPLTDDLCADLHDAYVREEVAAPAQIKEALDKIMSLLGTAGSETTRYGDILENFAGYLKSGTAAAAGDQFQVVVKAILGETRRMAEHNKTLEAQVAASSQQMADLKRDLDSAKQEAKTDGLTGLSNRRTFDAELRRLAEEADATRTPLSLMLLDIDHFKSVNDTLGHSVGDQVLKLVARIVTEGVKGQDVAARYGGEEFAVILPRTCLKDAITVAEHIRTTVAGRALINRNNDEKLGRVTLSAGVAELQRNETLASLINRADEGLYMAKRSGRNRVIAKPVTIEAKVA